MKKKINFTSYLSNITSIQYEKDRVYIQTKDGKYLYLEEELREEIYSYLDSISFIKYHSFINHLGDSFSLFLIEKDKEEYPLQILCDLYLKSSLDKNYDSIMIQNIYQKITFLLKNTLEYYYQLQDRIEEMIYPRESFYHLLLKMSDIYECLKIGKEYLELWITKQNGQYREVLTLNNISITNFCYGKIFDFSHSKRDYFVYELVNYYKKYYFNKNIIEEIKSFQKKFFMRKEENYLFYSLIAIPDKILGDSLEEVDFLLQYISKTKSFLLEKYKKDQEREDSMF